MQVTQTITDFYIIKLPYDLSPRRTSFYRQTPKAHQRQLPDRSGLPRTLGRVQQRPRQILYGPSVFGQERL